MSDNLDNISPSFNIESTFEIGAMGNTDLIKDLIAPETATASPDDITDIKDDKSIVKQPIIKDENTDNNKDDKNKNEGNPLASFLSNNNDDDSSDNDDNQDDTKDKNVSHETSNDDNQESVFSSFAKDLFKIGAFTKNEDEEDEINISTPEEFLDRFNKEKNKGAIEMVNNFIGQFGEDYQKAFEAIYVKGVNPKDYFGTYNQIVDFASMDLKEENNQIVVIRQSLEDQGWEKEDIDTEVERLKNYGDLEAVATRNHKVLVKKQAAKLQEEEQKSQQALLEKQQYKADYLNNVNSILTDVVKAKEIDGIPVSVQFAKEVQDFLVTDKYKTSSGEILTDFDKMILDLKKPENHKTKVKLGILMKMLEKDPTLSTIQKTGVSKKSTELFTEVARQSNKSSVKNTQKQQPTSWFK